MVGTPEAQFEWNSTELRYHVRGLLPLPDLIFSQKGYGHGAESESSIVHNGASMLSHIYIYILNSYVSRRNTAIAVLQSKNPRISQSPSPATDVGSIIADFHACLMACGMPSPGKGWFKTRRTSHLLFNIPHIHGHL